MYFKKIFFSAILTITLLPLMAQPKDDYRENWKKVEAFEKKGLPKSALQEVLVIYNTAKKNNHTAQQIKSAIYQIKYRNMIEEESRENNIFFIDTLIAQSETPVKNILQSMHAQMFWQHLQNNRWKFRQRTKLEEEKSKDINTWSIDKLYTTITNLYQASLQNHQILKSTSLEKFDAIIQKGENTRQLRPTLYDFLAHRALNYFMSGESDLTKPAHYFTIKDVKVFSTAKEFASTVFRTSDTASLQYHALLILQDILKFHLHDSKPDALIDADLIRLSFVNTYGIMQEKEKLYEAALKDIETKYPGSPAVAQAMFLRASLYYSKGQNYQAITKPENQYEIKKAKELLDLTVRKFPQSEGGIHAYNLLKQIEIPYLNLQTEKVNVPDQPFRTLVKYKNVKTIYLRLIKTSREEIKKLDQKEYEKSWESYVSLKPVKSWSIQLPDLQDYQEHATEIKVDGLPVGAYCILASIDNKFPLNKNIIAKQIIQVSNISYIHNNSNEYFVLHRNDGQPLVNTEVQVWEVKYDYQKSAYEEHKSERYKTDKNGYFQMNKKERRNNLLLQYKYGSDELFLDNYNNYYNYYNSYESPIKPQAFLFTDRSLYRPGQTLYFKGIVVQKNKSTKKSEILTGYTTKIILRDANYQPVSEIKVTTNEYGSYKGSFTLPEGSMNGSFSLYDENSQGNIAFNVEEYKRPKFYVEVPKPKGTYRLHDSVTVTGIAKAYAGNNIDGAKVKYRVVRKVRYPIWWEWGFYGKGYAPGNNKEVEIINGEAITDDKGEFKIIFKALPDESVDKKSQPVFHYEVSADITDINGETRSGKTSVAVAYQMLQLNIHMPEKISADSLTKLQIRSTNLNDIFEKTNVKVTIQKVQAPAKFFRERYWEMPDQFIMSKEEYYTYFPYDVYKDEDQVNKRPLENKVLEITDTTTEKSVFNIPVSAISGPLVSGWYKVTAATKDKYGEEVKAEKYIQLIDKNGQTKENREPVTMTVAKDEAEPGEQISYQFQTELNDKIWLIHLLNKMNDASSKSYLWLTKTQPFQSIIPVTEDDRGGMHMSYAFVKYNRSYTNSETFQIPWSNKELNISYETFRDKILPGSQEKWSIKITGNKGEKVAAEMLAGMYDASLDQFKPHSWNKLHIWPVLWNNVYWKTIGFENVHSEEHENYPYTEKNLNKSYDELLGFYAYYDRFEQGSSKPRRYSAETKNGNAPPPPEALQTEKKSQDEERSIALKDGFSTNKSELLAGKVATPLAGGAMQTTEGSVQVRKNFNETAFFFPDLKTDAEGNVKLEFTIPEALTEWKLMTMAHTKDLSSGYVEKKVITQKPLMVQPNPPRFMREGDRMEFSAKIVNLENKELTGTATLELLDATNNKPIDGWFKNVFPTQYFTVAAGQSEVVKFPMEIPFNFNTAMTYRIIAKAADFSDGEEMAIPILTNRMLVTESMPLNLRNQTTKTFTFDKLLNSNKSNSLSHHAITLEYSSNPAWYAVQALPYLMEYPYECAEQTFNRYYANTLATYVSKSIPKIKTVFDKWATSDTTALLSNLQKNEELKSVLLQETPWVLDAQNEAQQKKNIALLFDMVRMSKEQNKALNKLKEMQSSNGGFVWFKGGPDDRYITQYIITSIGHLRKLNALAGDSYEQVKDIVDRAIPYLDKKLKEDYDNLLRYKTDLKQNNLGYIEIQYLYMRSFYPEYKIADASQTAYNYFRSQAQKFWLNNSKYMQAMIALALHRTNDEKVPKDIIQSLKENAIVHEEMGMYWKEWATGGYYWHQAPIESQALMIEAFTDINKEIPVINDLKTWLLKQKQTQNWRTTKATAEACYALLLGGSNWLAEEKDVTITLGNTIIKSTDATTEAGTGYFKKRLPAETIKPEMGNIKVLITKTSNPSTTSWGSIYWQYFEDLDKITGAETPLKLNKKLFIEKNTVTGPVLTALADGAELKIGDKIKVRIELKADREMEYVHMKDMRAACMEPVNVISTYKYQGGLGYYESTKDASTNFFFSRLAKGTYVFEYPMFVTHAGNFSNGITTIQCMYAPEFTSHSEGIRVNVE